MKIFLSSMAVFALVIAGCEKPVKQKRTTAKKVKDHIYHLGNKDKAKREKALSALVRIGKPAVKQLIEALEGKVADRKTLGIGLAGATKGTSVISAKPGEDVSSYAARALGEIGAMFISGKLFLMKTENRF